MVEVTRTARASGKIHGITTGKLETEFVLDCFFY
jgi:hypothetical protein